MNIHKCIRAHMHTHVKHSVKGSLESFPLSNLYFAFSVNKASWRCLPKGYLFCSFRILYILCGEMLTDSTGPQFPTFQSF